MFSGKCAVVTVVALIVSARADWARDVVDYSVQIDALTSSGKNIIDVYDKIIEKSGTILKLGWPMGAMLAAGVDIGFKPDTEELAALKHLHSDMLNQFRVTNLKLQEIRNEVKLDLGFSDYLHLVTERLTDLRRTYKDVSNPTGNRHAYKDYFIFLCRGPSKPVRILDSIENLFVKGCKMSTANDVANLMKVDRALWDLEMRSPVTMNFYRQKRNVLAYVHQLNNAEVRDLVDAIQISNEEKLETISERLRHRSSVGYICIPQRLTDAYAHERRMVDEALREVANDIVGIQIMTAACGNITTNGSAVEMEKSDREVQDKIIVISKFIQKWLNHTQEAAWPQLFIEKAKQAMGTEVISRPFFNQTALLIQQDCEKRGQEKMEYQILVQDLKTVGENWYVSTLGSTHQMFSSNGVHVHIVRFDQESYERAFNATARFESIRSNVSATIELLKNGRYADGMSYKLQNDYQLLTQDTFHTMIVMRNGFEFAHWATIYVGKAFAFAADCNASSSLEFYENDMFPFYTYSWNLYLFV